MNDAQTPLSPAGVRRRKQILAIALRESRRRRQRRRIVRGGAMCIAVAAAVSLFSLVKYRTTPASSQVQHMAPVPAPQSAAAVLIPRRSRSVPEIVITRVKTDPQITSQLAVHPESASIERIGDDQLLEQLALAHRPAGLARLRGKVVLLYGASSHTGRTER